MHGSVAVLSRESVKAVLSQPAPEALRAFLRRWHGYRGEGGLAPAQARLPRALRDFYEYAGCAPSVFPINRLLTPEEVAVEDGYHVFYVEEQAVYLWAIAASDLAEDDPPVWCRENEPSEPWVVDSPSTSLFLLQMVVMSAAMSGPHVAVASWLSQKETDRALAPLEHLPWPPWRWPGHPARWYAGDETVAFTCPNRAAGDAESPCLSVWVSATSEEAIRTLEPHLSDAWDYYSPRDG